jgi:2-polyprenyl-6-methoxyphenol hydroxylase-like FAD-dependent oxidoreductase
MTGCVGTDVLIVGGGPAGAATAIVCAQAGLSVTLVERGPATSYRPGESLHPGIEPLLEQLGVMDAVTSAGFPRYAGHWVRWDSPRQFQAFGSDAQGTWRGFHAWRTQFERILLDHAGRLGVTIRRHCQAGRVMSEGGRITGALSGDGLLRARWVVDAAGGRHWLARQRNLAVARHSRPLAITYGCVEGHGAGIGNAPFLRRTNGGWLWTACVRPDTYAWVRLELDRRHAAPPPELQALRPLCPISGANTTWRIVAPMAGPGWFLVGDAASVLDPVASHGVLKAVMTGMQTAHHIVRILRGELRSPSKRLPT